MANKEKQLARARAKQTGESYALALAQLRKQNGFRQWIENVIDVGRVYFERWEQCVESAHAARTISAKTKLERDVITPEDTKRAREQTTSELGRLLALLNRGSLEQLARVTAMMWVGRDAHHSLGMKPKHTRADFLYQHRHAEQMIESDGRASVTHYVATKPLHTYLTAALRLASEIDFDLAGGLATNEGTHRSPEEALQASASRLYLRPFEEAVHRGIGVTTSLMSGRIQAGKYVVTVFGQHVSLQTVEAGEDRSGPYAIVLAGEFALADDFVLVVDSEPDELGLHGCELSVFRQVDLRIDLETKFSVYFDPGGCRDGSGGAQRGDGPASPAN